MKRIFLDPGHGYGDPGAKANGVVEADRTLTLAYGIKDFLVRRHSDEYTCIMLPEILPPANFDHSIPLAIRPALARAWRADLFVSLHFDAAPDNPEAHGPWVAYYRKRDYMLAKKIQKSLGCDSAWSRVRREDFQVLREAAQLRPALPAVLIEGGFLTNEDEAGRIGSTEITKIALSVNLGIRMAVELL